MYCFYSLHSFLGYFFSFVCICFLFVYSVCFSFFSICFVSVPPMAFPSHSKTQKKQIQNPNSKTQIKKRVCPGADAKAWSRKAQTFEPPLTIKGWWKTWAVCPMFFFHVFPVIKVAFFFSVRFIGFTITSQNAKKKNRESSRQGALPPVVNRISPL